MSANSDFFLLKLTTTDWCYSSNCADESDEHFCTYITLDGNNYRKELAPKNSREKSKMSVFIGFDVLEIVEINEPRVREQYWFEQSFYPILFY